eukprot:g2556.t1
MAELKSPSPSRYAVVEPASGRRLSYRLTGPSTASTRLVFIMGLGGTQEQWEPQEDHFAADASVQVLTLDNCGVGLSDPRAGRWTTRAMAQDVLALLDHCQWHHSVHVVGLSMGGMIAQELCLLQLPRFASLTLLSTIAGGLSSLGLFALSLPTGIRTLVGTFMSSSPQAQLDNGLRLLFPTPFLEESQADAKTGKVETNYKLLRRSLIARGTRSYEAARAAGVPPFRLTTVLKQAMAVTTHRVSAGDLRRLGEHFGEAALVVTGDSDILVHRRNASILSDGIPEARLVTLPGAGHGANEQCAVEVNAAIEDNVRRGKQRFPKLRSKL